ncbi:hypothetical protein cypCar_00013736, partial [Cyprinus carpio]
LLNIIEMEDDRRFHKLTQEQVENLDQVLTEVIPIHGRGNFPTLEIKPKDIIHVVRDRLILKKIKVRDVRLNGSTASHVLVKENGTSYKDLDIIFGVELPKPEDFQIIKEVVLGCLLDFLPKGVNKDKITALTMKEAYVQKMVKVFTEHDRWSLISLSNNSGKNVELKFVNSLRRQFEFSVDSFQIILDSMLQSYLDAERRKFVEGQEGQDSSLAQSQGIQTALMDEPLLSSCDTGHHQESDIDMSSKTDDIQTFRDSQCYCKTSQKEQSKYSEQEPTLQIDKDVETEMVQTTSTPMSMEEVSEYSVMVHVEEKNELHENVSLQTETLLEGLQPSAASVSHTLETSMSSVSEEVVSKISSPSFSDINEPIRPSKELPCITVLAESMYGDFEQAMDHLRYRLIATRNPEEIRGGGLLKYSNLLVRDFKPACETEIKTLERYMCSRFFIDFPDVNEQQRKIESYLRNHFIGEEKSKYDYLMTLRRVVNESTVCLMGHERRQTLNMITILALKVLGEQNIIPNANNVTCYYQPAPYMTDHNFTNYYISNGQSPMIYHPYPLHIHMQSGLV